MSDFDKSDIEKNGVFVDSAPAVHSDEFAVGETTYARLQRFAGKFGVEQRGIERVPEDERTDTSLWKVGTLWLSANMVVSSFAIGALAVPVFSLGFVDSFLTILFMNLLGIMPVCFFSTFGAPTGLRQMVLSRLWFGSYAVKVFAFFNTLACIGWSSANAIVGAQLINTVNPAVPGYAGIIIIGAGTLFITLFGYKIVHRYEMYSWIPCFIIFLVVLGEFAQSGAFQNIPMRMGSSEAGSVLSFAASVYGFATGWTSMAADYTCYQPVTSNRKRVFAWTFAGLIFPLCFTMWLGLAVATAIDMEDMSNPYTSAYENSHIGGLLGVVLHAGDGTAKGNFGAFCLIILALGIIANNCPNIYSLSFSLQLLTRYAVRVPRWVFTFVGTVIYCAIGIPGYNDFATYLENFMTFIAYWLAIYEGIALTEHFVFKRGSLRNYVLDDWETPSRQPPGIAAVVAFCFGVLGAVMGMSQVWFIGPIGRLIGDPKYGGDIGFELAFSFSAVAYLVLRSVEKSYFKR